jgi:hypothetical protein
MMLCVDNEMLHDALRDHGPGPLPAGAGAAGHGPRGDRRDDGHGDQVTGGQHRREILLRVVRISEALNQRLAL